MGFGELLSGTVATAQIEAKSTDDTIKLQRYKSAISGVNVKEGAITGASADTPIAANMGSDMDAWVENYGINVSKVFTADSPLSPTTQGAIESLAYEERVHQETVSELDALLDILTGRAAQVQLESIVGVHLTESDTPVAKALFDQIAVIANLSAGISLASILGEVASIGQIDRVGAELRGYLNDSGLTQIVGFGLGQMLSEIIGEPVGQELRAVSRYTLMPIGELIINRMRSGEYNPDEPTWSESDLQELAKMGYTDERATKILKAAEFYPAVQDWIRFAVRDVFNAEAVELGDYDADFPEPILEHTRKAGLSDAVVRWFWRAHWELPSPTMGFEMVHRRVITEDELRVLLRIADYAPAWIDKMIEISYNPLTRVDARRMYETGVLSDDEYRDAMLDLGYSPQNATRFVEWVKASKTQESKDLTLAQSRKAWDLGILTDEEFAAALTAYGYDDIEASTLLKTYRQEELDKLKESRIKLQVRKYVYRLSDEATLRDALNDLGLGSERREDIITNAKIEQQNRRKLPSRANLEKWYKLGVISEAVFIERMSQLGYVASDAALYLAAIDAAEEEEESEEETT